MIFIEKYFEIGTLITNIKITFAYFILMKEEKQQH